MQQPMVDEISLIDVFLVFKRHKKLFWGVVAFFMCLAVALSIVKSNHYEFSQKFQLAHYYHKSTIEPMIGLSDVLIELNTQVIPEVLSRYDQKNHQHLSSKDLTAFAVGYKDNAIAAGKVTRMSAVLVQLSMKGKKSMLPVYQQLFNEVYQQIGQRQVTRLNYFKKALVFQLGMDQQALADYQRDFTSLDLTLTKHPLVMNQAKGQSVAVTPEEIGVRSLSHIQELMTYRQMLSYRMSIQSKVDSLKASIQNKQFTLSTLASFKSKGDVFTSLKTVGLTKLTVFLLVCIFGFFIGLIAVFFAEFRQKIKQQDVR